MSNKVLIFASTGGIGEASARGLHAQGRELHLVGRHHGSLSPLARRVDEDDPFAFR